MVQTCGAYDIINFDSAEFCFILGFYSIFSIILIYVQ